MKASRLFSPLVIVLILAGVFLFACSSPETPTPIPPQDVQIVNITESDNLVGQIIQTKVYNLCDANSPLKSQFQFSESSTQQDQKEFVITAGASGSLNISAAASVALQTSVSQKFASINTTQKGYQEIINIEVPAKSQQEYVIVWKETRRKGTIEYTENGVTKYAEYSYRIGLELESSTARDISCFLTVTPSPIVEIPSATPLPPPTNTPIPPKPISQGCISAQTWKIDSTNTSLISGLGIKADSCYDTGGLGIFANRSGVLQLFDDNNKTQIASGIYLPIGSDSTLEFKIHVNYLYIVNSGSPAYINFAIAPASDPMATKNTARFKLQVEDVSNDPLVYFVLADVGENSGAPLTNQHYEYGRTYTIRLELVGSIMNVYINNIKQNESPTIPSGDKVFYIGYNLPPLAGIDAEVTNVKVDGVAR